MSGVLIFTGGLILLTWTIMSLVFQMMNRTHGWRELQSGAYRGYGRGVDGFVSNMSQPHYWWVTRRDQTVIEGYAQSIEAAKLEADNSAAWLLETRR